MLTVIIVELFAKTHPRKWLHDTIASQIVEGESLIGPIIEFIEDNRYKAYIEISSIISPEKWIVECIESDLEDGEYIEHILFTS